MANCTICGKRIVLRPSAAERAAKYGGRPSDYECLFTTHAACFIAKRDAETRDLTRRTADPASRWPTIGTMKR